MKLYLRSGETAFFSFVRKTTLSVGKSINYNMTLLFKHCALRGKGSINKRAIATLEELFGAVFSVRSAPRLYSESRRGNLASCRQ
jgi:hypothetical protein